MSTIRNFIIVDDDPWSNKICAIIIKQTLAEAQIHSFLIPEEGLAFIENEFVKNIQPAILFLDINMPSINGWQFLERFEKFGDDVKSKITIYMLSSSIDDKDIDKAKGNRLVKDFISKPMLNDTLLMVANNNITGNLHDN